LSPMANSHLLGRMERPNKKYPHIIQPRQTHRGDASKVNAEPWTGLVGWRKANGKMCTSCMAGVRCDAPLIGKIKL
jgi:hypothetical protein